jgi:hypothetical protein
MMNHYYDLMMKLREQLDSVWSWCLERCKRKGCGDTQKRKVPGRVVTVLGEPEVPGLLVGVAGRELFCWRDEGRSCMEGILFLNEVLSSFVHPLCLLHTLVLMAENHDRSR